jgi:signal transduction histidine kinase
MFGNLTTLFLLYFFFNFFDDSRMSPITYVVFAIPAIFFALWAVTPYVIPRVEIVLSGAQPKDLGLNYTLSTVYSLVYVAIGFVYLIRVYSLKRGVEREQIRMILYATVAVAILNLLGNYVLTMIGEDNLSFFMSGSSLFIFTVVITYTIVRHRLFNLRAVVARAVSFVLSIGFIAVLYAFLAYGIVGELLTQKLFRTETGHKIVFALLAVILAFTFPTIRRFFEKITDRIFYRDRYDPQQLVSDIGRVLASEILLEKLASKVLTIIQTQMHLSNGNIVVMGGDGIFYQTHADKIQQLYHAPELAKFNKGATIADELANNERRDILERHNVRAVFPLRTKETFVGYLLLGEKQSGDIFSSQDVQTLTIIADELAIAINNARSYQEIQRFNETLREKVRLATAELRHANVELKELDKAKDEFISMASHQLRTPLTAVRGYTSMVMDGDFGKVSGDQKDTLKQAFDAATRMTRLVDDLLNVSRIQSGKFRIERADVDLNKVLPEEVSMLASAAEMKHVTLTLHAPKTAVPVLQIDEGKTRQCLMNLMDNAIYYSAAAASGGKVEVYLDADKDWVSFKVVDNGIGVPKDEQAKLFKKFYRAPNAQKTRPDGTGLGLFLVGKVVKDQGGEIIFESVEGKGSTFGFKLPVKTSGEGVGAEVNER